MTRLQECGADTRFSALEETSIERTERQIKERLVAVRRSCEVGAGIISISQVEKDAGLARFWSLSEAESVERTPAAPRRCGRPALHRETVKAATASSEGQSFFLKKYI